jgi:hypothetical protein
MFSKREMEGYVMIDHRDSPGFTQEEAARLGLGGLPVGRGTLFQSPTITCHVCQAVVIINPDRSRSRGYCPKHNAYSCDACNAERVRTGICKPFQQVIDEFVDAAENGKRYDPQTGLSYHPLT